MKRPTGAKRKRRAVPARLKAAVPGVKRRIKAQTVEFAVFGDSHVGYGNSLSTFRSLLPKAVSSGNKRFFIFGEITRRPGQTTGTMPARTIRNSRTR